MKIKLLYIMFSLSAIIHGQVKVINYNESNHEIELDLFLESVDLLSVEDMSASEIGDVYFDENREGEFALPSKEVFIAIPDGFQISIKDFVIEKNDFSYNLGFNPKPTLNRDSSFSISFENLEYRMKRDSPRIEILGYLNINGVYCVHLRINQYSFDEKKKIVSELKKIKLKLKSNKPIQMDQYSRNGERFLDKESNIIINYKQSHKFVNQKNKNLINDTTYNWIDFTKTYLKLGTAQDGIYRLYKSDLENSGINSSIINPKTFQLFLNGKEIPIYVNGESDQNFDENDFIEFYGIRSMGGKHREIGEYGQPYNEYLGRYTDTTVYWLTWGDNASERVYVKNNKSLQLDTLKYYNETIHLEKNIWFDFSTDNQVRREQPFWIENKTWGWGAFSGGGAGSYTFELTDIYPNKTANLFVKLQSYATTLSQNAHQLSLSINNGSPIDTASIEKHQKVVLNTEINSDNLKDGTNILKVHSFQNASIINLCFFDWAEIEYPRYLKSVNDSLAFQFPFIPNNEERNIKVTNISDSQIVLWKKGKSYKKFNVNAENNAITFNDTITSIDKYILVKEKSITRPKIYYKKKFKNLRDSSKKADYIAITHKKFLPKVSEYCNFISDNYNVAAIQIDVDDIYDEFSFGQFNPEAIKDFLKSTDQFWQYPKPEYVMLIGGATYDYYGNKYKNLSSVKSRVINYVPSFGAPVSDNWFVTWDTTGAYVPQMNIGRIPVTTNDELQWYFEKHQSYVSQNYDDWNKRYLFFSSGDAASSSELSILREANQFVIDNFLVKQPIGGQYEHFYKTVSPPTNFGPYTKEYFQNAIDKGGVFISYLGHSGTQIWDNSITSPLQLMNNRNRYPIISDFGCSTGKFAEPDITSFSELFTLAGDGQAIAYIGNSSLGFVSSSILAPKLFYGKILKENKLVVSEALNEAKIEMLQQFGSSEIYKLFALTNTLIGDPILSLPIPSKPNFVLRNDRLELSPQVLTDLLENLTLTINIKNLGSVLSDSLELLVIHKYKNLSDSIKIKIESPNYEDSVSVNIPIKNKVGNHTISVEADSQNKFDEIYENDNNAQIEFNVASSLIRPLLQYQITNGLTDQVKLLNPTTAVSDEKIELEIAEDNLFSNKEVHEIPFGEIYSTFNFDKLNSGQRYWGRTKTKSGMDYSPPFSFTLNKSKFYINDSLSYSGISTDNLVYKSNGWIIDTALVDLEVFSAGFEDGQAAIISRNGINYVPTPLVGHHVAVFNSESPYDFIEYRYFNTYAGGESTSNYIQYLDTLSTDRLVAIAVSDEGTPKNDELKRQIKLLGSKYVDNIAFRSSWAFIGRKGAVIGSVPEAISKAGEGPVTIDTTYKFVSDSGKIVSQNIGSASKWEKLTIEMNTPSNSNIHLLPLGIKDDGSIDTLAELKTENSSADLSFIDPKLYPNLKILAVMKASDDEISPELYSLGIDYNLPSELAVNYQVVSISNDSVNVGEDIELNFDVYNVGESQADSFYVEVELANGNNTTSTNVFKELVISLDSLQKKSFNINYNTVELSGNYKFNIKIDTEDKILELYEDNNFYSIPFYVKPDTTIPMLNLTFDGKDIFDGEYISPKPNIKIELTDLSLVPVTDTSSVVLFLDDEPVYYSNNSQINYSVSNTNPKYVVEFKPELEDGEHSISVFAKDASGNFAEQNGLTKNFVVSNKVKLLDLYNYPNPFASDTYFTFKLTQIPDEVRIKVYTIAGRLVKEIRKTSTELNYDFNKIYWDSRDEDGDLLANGVYIYRVVMEAGGVSEDITQKLAIVR